MRDVPDYDDLLEDYRGEDFEVIIAVRRPGGEPVQAAVIPSARISLIEAFDTDFYTWASPVAVRSSSISQFRITTPGGYTVHDPSVVQGTKEIGDGG